MQQARIAKPPAPAGRATAIAGVLALAAATAIVAISPPYEPGSDVGYAMGLAGALMMLMLLAYPLRKHWSRLRAFGPLRYWFRGHMVLGVVGPLLVVFHSTFRVASLNAAVALGSMLLVVASGLIGRFIYTRIHHGLYGSIDLVEKLQAELSHSESSVRDLLDLAPKIEPILKQFFELAQSAPANPLARAWRFATFGWRNERAWRKCRKELKIVVRANLRSGRWRREEAVRRYQEARGKIWRYLALSKRVAQFRSYERLFSLWHVAHIPFVYMLAASAVVHVVAVHMY
ncbi:MAG: hypothetical protein WA373_09740 [Burkholderiales bacterium]